MSLHDTSDLKEEPQDQTHHTNTQSSRASLMSEEESKIRGELESVIERDLEEEIKDSMCCLALRLYNLHQHKNSKNKYDASTRSGARGRREDSSNNAFREMKITITVDGGCKIEIGENKIGTTNVMRLLNSRPPQSKRGWGSGSSNQFDWSRSLRA